MAETTCTAFVYRDLAGPHSLALLIALSGEF